MLAVLLSPLPPVATDAGGLTAALLLLVILWVVGCAIAGRRDPAERLAAGLGVVLGVSLATMLQPLGFPLLGHHRLVEALVVAGLLVAVVIARDRLLPRRFRLGALLWGVLPAVVVSLPLVTMKVGTPVFYDLRWHEGWVRQLLGGGHAPSGAYAGSPNDYPWLYHSLASILQLGLPGGMASMFWALQAF